MIVELPILFAQVSARGAITLEPNVFARKDGTRAYGRMPSKATWVDTYRDIDGSEYTGVSLEALHRNRSVAIFKCFSRYGRYRII